MKSDIPTKTSQLTNDSNFLTSAALSLTNYYTKSEVDGKVSSIPKFSIAVVTALPTENISNTTVYLVKTGSESQNLYTEYIYVTTSTGDTATSTWEELGTQSVDLSGYLTSANADRTYYRMADADIVHQSFQNQINSKQDKLIFDTTPTDGSTNPITSGVVKNELDKYAKKTDLSQYAKKTDVPAITVSGDFISFGSVKIGVD